MDGGHVSARVERIELAIVIAMILLAAIVCPLLLRGSDGFLSQNSQFFLGPVVNAALIIAAINFRKLSTAVTIFAPSVFALAGGLFLALGNIFALYMIPAIWLGNLALVLVFKYMYKHKKLPYISTAVVAILLKAAIIFAGYNILVAVDLIPAGSPAAIAMFSMMGIYQVITATLGAILAASYLISRPNLYARSR